MVGLSPDVSGSFFTQGVPDPGELKFLSHHQANLEEFTSNISLSFSKRVPELDELEFLSPHRTNREGFSSFFKRRVPDQDEFEFLNQTSEKNEGIQDGDEFVLLKVVEALGGWNEEFELTTTDGGLWHSQANQHQPNQVETSERSYLQTGAETDQFEFPDQTFEKNEFCFGEITDMPFEAELMATKEILMFSQANQRRPNQLEICEGLYQAKPDQSDRARLTPAQRERKRLTDYKYRQKRKQIVEDLTERGKRLKEEKDQLLAENQFFKAENQQLKADKLLNNPVDSQKRNEQLLADVNRDKDHHGFNSGADAKLTGLQIDEGQQLQEIVPVNAIAASDYVTDDQKEFQTGNSCHVDLQIPSLLMKIDADEESKVELSDFSSLDLDEERKTVGKYSFPLSLHPTVNKIIYVYGDVSAASKMNKSTVETNYIMFCAAVKEMSVLQLEQITTDKILKWRDSIKDALRINFKVGFALEHLKKIVCAYIGRIMRRKRKIIEKKISKLEDDLIAEREELANICEQSNVYMDAADHFNGKPLSSGMF